MQLRHLNPHPLPMDASCSIYEIEQWLIKKFAEQASLPEELINSKELVTSLGMDSMDAVMIAGDLEEWLDIEVPSTLLWDYPTIGQIAEYLYAAVAVKTEAVYKQAG